ncbi:MAG: TetR/AcrR family transcriptional regulator [Novosphingobium sp.]|nr:TetR/AcrR family transcriptional regulator [Novosphingobium sp.]
MSAGGSRRGRSRRTQREETQARLIDATVELLRAKSLMELAATDIAARAGLSNAAFYVYFRDVYDAVLAACARADQSPPELLAVLESPWSAATAREAAAALTAGYFAVWDTHRPVLRARNLAADEGRLEFVKARQLAVAPLAGALRRQIEAGQAAARIPRGIDPLALTNVLLALLERTGAVRHDYADLTPRWQQDYGEAVVHTLLSALGFGRPVRI